MKYLLLSFIFGISALMAEVQSVVIIWNPGLCWDSCIVELENQFRRIPAVERVNMSQGTGRAELIWKPSAPFSFQPINAALRYVGVRQGDIRLKVRGRIIEEAGQIKLVSSGDNTTFTLLNPIIPNQNEYVPQFNPQTRPLSAQLIDAFQTIRKNDEIVIVEGPFFEPFRSPPNRLVVERYAVDKRK